jgi:hypothetical protein
LSVYVSPCTLYPGIQTAGHGGGEGGIERPGKSLFKLPVLHR